MDRDTILTQGEWYNKLAPLIVMMVIVGFDRIKSPILLIEGFN